MDYQLNTASLGAMFALPATVKLHLREASGTSLKVLLFILSSLPDKPPVEKITSCLELTSEQTQDAIRYWIEKEILAYPQKETPVIQVIKPTAQAITTKELKEEHLHNEQAKFLFQSAEQLYARPLNATERRTLLYILQSTLLPVDVVLMILDYSLRVGKASPQYIMKLCEDWNANGINSHQAAEEKIRYLLEKNSREQLVKSCFGIHGRNLSKKECDFVDKWMVEYAFEINMIRLAYEKTIDAIGKISFPYINTILASWFKENLSTPEQVSRLQEKNNGKNEASPSYNLDELAKRGLYIPET